MGSSSRPSVREETTLRPSTRRSTALSLDRDLLDAARALGVDLSRAAERGLAEAVRRARATRWQAENAAAIDAWNAFIEQGGVPLAAFRKV